jgi:hypothetical protein
MLLPRWSGIVLLAGLALLNSGCTKGQATVSGKVTFEGKVVSSGSVIMAGEDKIPKTGAIDKDGNYSITGVIFGSVNVAVISPDPNRSPFAKLPPGTKKGPRPVVAENTEWFAIPAIYGDLRQSEITFTISQKDTIFNIELKKKGGEETDP